MTNIDILDYEIKIGKKKHATLTFYKLLQRDLYMENY